jgi:hypothetical protein
MIDVVAQEPGALHKLRDELAFQVESHFYSRVVSFPGPQTCLNV